MSSIIPFEQVEAAAHEILDHHAKVGRPLNKSERRDFAGVLEMYESVVESREFRKLPKDIKARHHAVIDALRNVIEPPPPEEIILEPLSLEDLETRILAVLDVAESFKRPLSPEERKPFRPLLAHCYADHIKEAVAAMDDSWQDHYVKLFTELREAIAPDPPIGEGELVPRFTRVKNDQRVERHKGNNAVKSKAIEGMDVRRMTTEEVRAAISFISRLCSALVVLTQELALVSPRHRPVVLEIVRSGTYASAAAERFVAGFKLDDIPDESTPAEIAEHARIMGELNGNDFTGEDE